MGILDALRGRKSGDDDGARAEIGPGDPSAPEPMQFQPRTDGSYVGDGSRLRFGGGRVTETADQIEAPASPARTGEYTPTGRFSVSAPFEMLVAFTVLETGDDFFVARRTSVADRTSADVRYQFSSGGS